MAAEHFAKKKKIQDSIFANALGRRGGEYTGGTKVIGVN